VVVTSAASQIVSLIQFEKWKGRRLIKH
jgi:hypothetical protein